MDNLDVINDFIPDTSSDSEENKDRKGINMKTLLYIYRRDSGNNRINIILNKDANNYNLIIKNSTQQERDAIENNLEGKTISFPINKNNYKNDPSQTVQHSYTITSLTSTTATSGAIVVEYIDNIIYILKNNEELIFNLSINDDNKTDNLTKVFLDISATGATDLSFDVSKNDFLDNTHDISINFSQISGFSKSNDYEFRIKYENSDFPDNDWSNWYAFDIINTPSKPVDYTISKTNDTMDYICNRYTISDISKSVYDPVSDLSSIKITWGTTSGSSQTFVYTTDFSYNITNMFYGKTYNIKVSFINNIEYLDNEGPSLSKQQTVISPAWEDVTNDFTLHLKNNNNIDISNIGILNDGSIDSYDISYSAVLDSYYTTFSPTYVNINVDISNTNGLNYIKDTLKDKLIDLIHNSDYNIQIKPKSTNNTTNINTIGWSSIISETTDFIKPVLEESFFTITNNNYGGTDVSKSRIKIDISNSRLNNNVDVSYNIYYRTGNASWTGPLVLNSDPASTNDNILTSDISANLSYDISINKVSTPNNGIIGITNNDKTSDFYDVVFSVPNVIPAIPTFTLSGSYSSNNITISNLSSTNTDGQTHIDISYNIKYKQTSLSGWNTLSNSLIGTSPGDIIVDGLLLNTNYYFSINTYNNSGDSGSLDLSFTTLENPPPVPTFSTSSAIYSGNEYEIKIIDLSTANSINQNSNISYNIFYKERQDNSWTEKTGITGRSVSSISLLTNAPNGKTYDISLNAYITDISSLNTIYVGQPVTTQAVAPNTPSYSLSTSRYDNDTKTKITINSLSTNNDNASFNIKYKQNTQDGWTTLTNSLSGTGPHDIDISENILSNILYDVSIDASNNAGTSSSKDMSITTKIIKPVEPTYSLTSEIYDSNSKVKILIKDIASTSLTTTNLDISYNISYKKQVNTTWITVGNNFNGNGPFDDITIDDVTSETLYDVSVNAFTVDENSSQLNSSYKQITITTTTLLMFNWLRDSIVIPQAESEYYSLIYNDLGKSISVQITNNGITKTKTLNYPILTNFTYQWSSNYVELSGETNDNYTVSLGDTGQYISVKLTKNGNFKIFTTTKEVIVS